jgi:hypothetical protein
MAMPIGLAKERKKRCLSGKFKFSREKHEQVVYATFLISTGAPNTQSTVFLSSVPWYSS